MQEQKRIVPVFFIRRRLGFLLAALLLFLFWSPPLRADVPPAGRWGAFIALALAADTPQAFAEVETLLQRLRRSGTEWEPDNRRLLWSLVRLAQFYRMEKNWTKAAHHQLQVLQLLEAQFGLSDLLLVTPLSALAVIQRAQGQYSLARQSLQRALTIVEATTNPTHLLAVQILEQLAEISVAQGNPQEAQTFYKRIAKIHEQALMMETPGDAIILARQGKRRLQEGHEMLALSLFRLSKEILMESSGPYHSVRVEVLSSLAHILFNEGAYTQAVELLKSALAISENMWGSKHPDLLPTLQSLAVCYQNMGKPNLSRPIIVRSLALVEALYGADHQKTATILLSLAENLRLENQLDPAVTLYNRGMVIFRHQKLLSGLAQSLMGLAKVQQMQGKLTVALRTHQEALQILLKTQGADHPEYQAAHRLQTELRGKLEEKQQATPTSFTSFARQLQAMQDYLLTLGGAQPTAETTNPIPLLP